jgi:hypothetical protein
VRRRGRALLAFELRTGAEHGGRRRHGGHGAAGYGGGHRVGMRWRLAARCGRDGRRHDHVGRHHAVFFTRRQRVQAQRGYPWGRHRRRGVHQIRLFPLACRLGRWTGKQRPCATQIQTRQARLAQSARLCAHRHRSTDNQRPEMFSTPPDRRTLERRREGGNLQRVQTRCTPVMRRMLRDQSAPRRHSREQLCRESLDGICCLAKISDFNTRRAARGAFHSEVAQRRGGASIGPTQPTTQPARSRRH